MALSDRELKHLMDCMHTCSGSVINAHEILSNPDDEPPEILEMAEKLKEEHALKLARDYNAFIYEIIDRRNACGNFQYPFEPFDEWGKRDS
ncbi:MAG: hypothetical protein ABJO52_20860 [Nisaea sp.]|uniref:hypothetical protein n=1 Tax=Nisaea sp. TaxID=2024842 RepID=UPI0032998008